MVLEKDIIIVVKRRKAIQHYIELGYDCCINIPFKVCIEDLKHSCKNVITAKCEKCNTIVERRYDKYISNKTNQYFSCSLKCSKDKIKKTCLERYGTESVTKSKHFKEKSKQTCIEKYGTEHASQSNIIKDKVKQTCIDKYGVDSVSKVQEFKEKSKQTCIEKYGVEYSIQSEEVKNKVEKTNNLKFGGKSPMHCEKVKDKVKQTCIDKYGVDNVFKSEDIKESIKETNLKKYGHINAAHGKDSKEKIKATNLKKYDNIYPNKSEEIKRKIKETNINTYKVEHIFQSNVIKDKIKITCLEKYGVDHISKSEDVKRKIKDTYLKNYGVTHYKKSKSFKDSILNNRIKTLLDFNIDKNDILNVDFEQASIKCCKCSKVYTTNYKLIYVRLKSNKEACINCNPIGSLSSTSKGEKELSYFIKENYNGTILENNRKVLYPQELDVYLPDINLAFEFNGLYWHSEIHKPKNYHLDKTNKCLEKNIQLIHVYEDDWNFKQDIVKSRILNLLGKSEKIYAIKTIVKEVSFKDSKDFLDNNHLQGNVNSKIRLGLYCNNALVSLMTFGSLRKNLGHISIKDHYELLRFCNKLNYSIIGGASKLFKHFLKTYTPKEIISYADRSWSKGDLYKMLNFKYIKNTGINYYYSINDIRENRYKYRKNILVKEGYDDNMTEHSIMLSRNIYRVYDSGSCKFLYKNS